MTWEGSRSRRASQWLLLCLACSRATLPKTGQRLVRELHLLVRTHRQRRAGQLRGGEDGCGGPSTSIALDMQRHGVRSNCIIRSPLEPADRETIPPTDEIERKRIERLRSMTADKIARSPSFSVRMPRANYGTDLQRAQERDFPFQSSAADPLRRTGRGLDCTIDRGAASAGIPVQPAAARARGGRVSLGSRSEMRPRCMLAASMLIGLRAA